MKVLLLAGIALSLTACNGAGAGLEELPTGPYNHMEGVPLNSTDIGGWATSVTTYSRGSEVTGFEDTNAATGPASGISTDVFVLGRGGTIDLEFGRSFGDGPYAEFAVFENGLGSRENLFAELAYVEVSSDSTNWVRFAVATTRTTAVSNYGRINAAEYSGFAGLHPLGSGTAFDLAELAGAPEVAGGQVDLSAIRYVRLVDVVGDGSEKVPPGNTVSIYDPYPTTGTAGFDLHAVALLKGGQ
jgi:hypothetical protein